MRRGDHEVSGGRNTFVSLLGGPVTRILQRVHPQTKAGGSSDAGEHHSTAIGAAEESGRRVGCNVPHLPENQVCGRCRPYMPLLQNTVLRQMRWKSYAEK